MSITTICSYTHTESCTLTTNNTGVGNEFVALAIEFVTLAKEFILLAIDFVTLALVTLVLKNLS